MSSYIGLIDLTDQGVRNFGQSPGREKDFEKAAQALGLTVKQAYWTLGSHDGVLIFEAADDETATAAMLSLASQGNVRTQTLRAFDAAEFAGIVAKVS